eukprot:COSAG01_NODE_428_length_17193_cov_45.999123_4_plen_143_part_00
MHLPLSRSSAAMVATTRLGGGVRDPWSSRQTVTRSLGYCSKQPRSGAGWHVLPVRQRQPAGRGRMTSPYAEKALSERAAGTKGAWTQLRSGNLSGGECSLSAIVTKFTLGRFYCHITDSYRNRTPSERVSAAAAPGDYRQID